MSEFRVVKRFEGDGAVIIAPEGDLDLGGARLLASVLAHAVGSGLPQTVIEADKVRRIDVAAVRFLIVAWPRDGDGRPLCQVHGASSAVRRVFEFSGAPDLLAAPAVDQAADFGRGRVAVEPGAKAV